VATVLLAAGCGALAGCGARPYADYEPEAPAGGAPPQVTFEASVRPDGDRLLISYKLVNTGPVAVVAYNGMQLDGAPAQRDAVYVTARRDGTVEVAKRAYEVPDGVDPGGAELLRGTVLAPRAQLAEKVTVPLPLVGRRPYLSAVKLPDAPSTVVFCLGVERLEALQAPVPNPDGDADPDSRPLFTHPTPQHLLCSERVALAPGSALRPAPAALRAAALRAAALRAAALRAAALRAAA
jgi:hypothetical protein